MKYYKRIFICLLVCICFAPIHAEEHSIAREWNELILNAIRNDFARPTMHARNLFHTSIAMYDSWAIYDDNADSYLIGQQKKNFVSDFDIKDIDFLKKHKDLNKTISFAIYRLFLHRYSGAPKFQSSKAEIDSFMIAKGYDIQHSSFDYTDGDPASLGNFIGLEVIKYGLSDGANEQNGYANRFYEPVNAALNPLTQNTTENIDPNRWQPLFFIDFIDQAGNPLPEAIPEFLSPEWGEVESYSLTRSDQKTMNRNENPYNVYMDPGPPSYIGSETDEAYKWGFSLVAQWSSHLDPSDPYMIDISPSSIGNIDHFPSNFEEYKSFYSANGGDWSQGHSQNPSTGQPYDAQYVSRGDYARVLAEFWADGPDSETPPGHWFTILNYVMDQPTFERKFNGKVEMSILEYDIKSYFTLGGALHDAAIAAWSVKGYYDYIRPISALRYMADKGQSSYPNMPNYHKEGIILVDGYIELVEENDPDFLDSADIGKIKFKSWRGPSNINDPNTDIAGVGWILAEDWWPYQRPTFITPPFAGYISGHSTFSRTAAEVLTYLTGDPFFPGGLGEFIARKNSFLVFEQGPSTDITLQWATYRDASDQCSLSRIWGGIHPPIDDIPGRKIGILVASRAINKSVSLFDGEQENESNLEDVLLFPNPATLGETITIYLNDDYTDLYVLNESKQLILHKAVDKRTITLPTTKLTKGYNFVIFRNQNRKTSKKIFVK